MADVDLELTFADECENRLGRIHGVAHGGIDGICERYTRFSFIENLEDTDAVSRGHLDFSGCPNDTSRSAARLRQSVRARFDQPAPRYSSIKIVRVADCYKRLPDPRHLDEELEDFGVKASRRSGLDGFYGWVEGCLNQQIPMPARGIGDGHCGLE